MDISTFFIVINFLFLFSYSLYFWTNSEILSDDEIKELSNSQRFWDLQNYFSFTKGQFIVDKKFKSGLNTKGQFYFCNEPLNNFPAIASALLKGKKHEWVIFAFVKNKNVFSFYINKGDDNQSVTPNISPEFIRKFAKDNNSEIILEFHNHPNAILGASKQDIISANYFGTLFAEYEINYLAFVCSTGYFYQYGWWFIDKFYSYTKYQKVILVNNGVSRSTNFEMRREMKRKSNYKRLTLNSNSSFKL